MTSPAAPGNVVSITATRPRTHRPGVDRDAVQQLLGLLAGAVAWAQEAPTAQERSHGRVQAEAYAHALGVVAAPDNTFQATHVARLATDLVTSGPVCADDVTRLLRAANGPGETAA